jgi:hypothetical protein
MKRSLFLAGLLTAPTLWGALPAQAQSLPYAVVTDSYNIETNDRGVVLVSVVLSQPSTKPVSIQWKTRDGNAKAGSDYNASSGTVNFAEGQRVAVIAVPIIGDSIEEADEYFSIVLSNAQGANILDSVGNIAISDNDYAGTISVQDVSRVEGNSGKSNFGFRVILSTPPLHPILVGYRTVNGSARAGSDYTSATGALQFFPKEQSKVVNVAVAGDTVVEANETFSLQLGSLDYTLAKPSATSTIVNDDTAAPSPVGPSGGTS